MNMKYVNTVEKKKKHYDEYVNTVEKKKLMILWWLWNMWTQLKKKGIMFDILDGPH